MPYARRAIFEQLDCCELLRELPNRRQVSATRVGIPMIYLDELHAKRSCKLLLTFANQLELPCGTQRSIALHKCSVNFRIATIGGIVLMENEIIDAAN